MSLSLLDMSRRIGPVDGKKPGWIKKGAKKMGAKAKPAPESMPPKPRRAVMYDHKMKAR